MSVAVAPQAERLTQLCRDVCHYCTFAKPPAKLDSPFLPLDPSVYGNMLRELIAKHNVDCWLVNTGWTGGPFGIGKRISIQHTRRLLNAALSDKLQNVRYRQDRVFGFDVPEECEGVPSQILNPADTWPSRDDYYAKCHGLAARFVENFKRMNEGCPPEVVNAGPKPFAAKPATKA